MEELRAAVSNSPQYEKHLNDVYQVYKLLEDDGDFMESVRGILDKKI